MTVTPAPLQTPPPATAADPRLAWLFRRAIASGKAHPLQALLQHYRESGHAVAHD